MKTNVKTARNRRPAFDARRQAPAIEIEIAWPA
jgi:hypothetical protein